MTVAGCGPEQVLRHNVTGELAYVPCGSWRCPACARMLAREWRAVLHWTAAQGHAPLWFITRRCRAAVGWGGPLGRTAQRQNALLGRVRR